MSTFKKQICKQSYELFNFVFVVFFLFLIFCGCFILFVNLTPVVYRDTEIELIKGDGPIKLCSRISKMRSIRFNNAICLYARLNWLFNKKYFSGRYVLQKGFTTVDVIKQIGSTEMHKITIPEGLTVYEVLELLEKDNCVKYDLESYKQIPEGSLMPETYLFTCGVRASEVINKMKTDMSNFISYEWENRDPVVDKILYGQNDAINLAAIIEKESSGAVYEYHLIASVLFNRIRKGIRLEVCPTLIYALTNGMGQSKFKRRTLHKDLWNNTPYNSYRNKGLPPTPIANPGKEAIKAALHPANTNYLFFVGNLNGGHDFSATFEEHINKKNKYKKLKGWKG